MIIYPITKPMTNKITSSTPDQTPSTLGPTPAAADPAQPIPHDLPCIHCSYNLRTLNANSLCPECGHPAADSLRSNLLRHADTQWVKRLTLGYRLANAALLAFVFLFPAAVASGILIDALTLSSHANDLIERTLNLLTLFWISITTVAFILGWWLAATPDPARSSDITRQSGLAPPHTALRILAILVAPAWYLWISATVAPPLTRTIPFGVELQALLGFLLIWAFLLALIRNIQPLAGRCTAPNPKQKQRFDEYLKKCKSNVALVPAGLLALFIVALILQATGRLPRVLAHPPAFLGTSLSWIIMGLFFLAVLSRLGKDMRRLLNHELQLNQQQPASPTPDPSTPAPTT